MALLDTVSSSADLHFQRTAARLLEEATPKPPPEPLLQRPQSLARIAPQPERLLAVNAARSPLIEAARPLLEIRARLPVALDPADQDAFHRAVVGEVVAFQSIAQDAGMYGNHVLMASYVLCAALDEAIGHAPWARAHESTALGWKGRLCVEMHRASNGGEGFFLLLGGVTLHQPENLDLLELMMLLLVLGFQGMYGERRNGLRVLYKLRHEVYMMLYALRQAEPTPRWRAIERMLQSYSLEDVLADITLEELFS